MTNNMNDEQLGSRVRALLAHAVVGLDVADQAERVAYCVEHDEHGIRMHRADDDDLIEFRWVGRPLAMVRRQDLTTDTPLTAEYITEVPNTIEGLTDD